MEQNLKKLLYFVIKGYQFISAGFLPHCRFYPSCSSYALEALEKFGVLKAIFLTFKRLLRCHPWSKDSGYDPLED